MVVKAGEIIVDQGDIRLSLPKAKRFTSSQLTTQPWKKKLASGLSSIIPFNFETTRSPMTICTTMKWFNQMNSRGDS